MENEQRRMFLKTCIGGVAVAAAGGIAFPVYHYLAPKVGDEGSGKVTIPDQAVLQGGSHYFQYSGHAAVLVRKEDGSLSALSAVCTHLGCVVQWQKDKHEFLCPCHAGRFSMDGAVLGGPPARPLEKLPVIVANGMITVG